MRGLIELREDSHARSADPTLRDVLSFLDAAESPFPERDFLVSDERLTYRRVGELSRRAAASLASAGVRHGDRVLLTAGNQVDVVLITLAALRLGAIVALLHEGTTRRNLKRVVEQIEPAVAVLDRSTVDLRDVLPGWLVIGIDTEPELAGVLPVQQLFAAGHTTLPHVSVAPDDPVFLIFTSGSSGEPRGVIVSQDNVIFSTGAIQERLAYERDDVVGLFVPLAFDYGLYQIFLAANVGASIYVGQPSSVGPAILRLIERHHVSVLPAVPSLIGSLLKLLDRGTEILPDLRCITSTGDHLPAPHIERLQQRLPGAKIFPMYGLTECKRVSILLPQELTDRKGTVGRPLTGTKVRVVSPAGDALPAGVSGELVVTGRNVTLGYWQHTDETQRRFRVNEGTGERELWTGDICEVDKEGFVRVLGRNDALLKHQGFRISSAEVELEACRFHHVVEARLVCSAKGELHLFARLSGENGGPAGIRQLLSNNLEWFKVPEHVHVVDDLPRTLNGKTDRTELQALANGFDAH